MNARVHGELTRQWAQEMGIGGQAAAAIAAANLEVDAARFPRDWYHMRPRLLLGRDRRGQTAEHHLEQARAAAGRDPAAALRHLGYGLHALQDQVSHGGAWLLGIHWGPWLDDPERSWLGRQDPNRHRLATVARATRAYLARALADERLRGVLSG